MRFVLAFILLLTQTTWGETANKTAEFNYVLGTDYYTNWVLNPQANKNLSNTTTSNAALTRDTTNKLDNIASYSLDTSANGGYAEFSLGSIVAPATAGNCEFKGVYKGDASLYSAQVVDGSANVLASAQLQNTVTNWQTFSVAYPCAASGSRKVRITQSTAGTSPAINVGKLYYGQFTGMSGGVPNNTFVAEVSATGVVSLENQDFINGNCVVSDTSLFTCTFNTNFFSIQPICHMQIITNGISAAYTMNMSVDTTTTSVVARTGWTSSTIDYTKQAWPFHLTCTRSSTDWVQPTIQAPNWDTDWTSYTPTLTGFGTVTNLSAWWRRNGDTVQIKGYFTAGTVTAVTATWTLPTGLIVDPNKVSSLSYVGSGTAGTTATTNFGNVTILASPNATSLNFGVNSSTSGQSTTAQNGNVATSTGSILEFTAQVPILGWTKTLNAPLLVGSVTSNNTGAQLVSSVNVGGGGANGTCSTTPCTLTSNDGFTSVTRGSAGQYTANLSNIYSSNPKCSIIPLSNTAGNGVPIIYINNSGVTGSSFGISCYRLGVNTVDDCSFSIQCSGPR